MHELCPAQLDFEGRTAKSFFWHIAHHSVMMSRYDAGRAIARLEETWVSVAAAQQRRGRAGRVQPGMCFRLFSRATFASMEV